MTCFCCYNTNGVLWYYQKYILFHRDILQHRILRRMLQLWRIRLLSGDYSRFLCHRCEILPTFKPRWWETGTKYALNWQKNNFISLMNCPATCCMSYLTIKDATISRAYEWNKYPYYAHVQQCNWSQNSRKEKKRWRNWSLGLDYTREICVSVFQHRLSMFTNFRWFRIHTH